MSFTEEEKKKDLFITILEFQNFNPSQVENFRIYSNPLSYDDVNEEILNYEQFDYLNPSSSPYTPITSKILVSQLNVKVPSYPLIQ